MEGIATGSGERRRDEKILVNYLSKLSDKEEGLIFSAKTISELKEKTGYSFTPKALANACYNLIAEGAELSIEESSETNGISALHLHYDEEDGSLNGDIKIGKVIGPVFSEKELEDLILYQLLAHTQVISSSTLLHNPADYYPSIISNTSILKLSLPKIPIESEPLYETIYAKTLACEELLDEADTDLNSLISDTYPLLGSLRKVLTISNIESENKITLKDVINCFETLQYSLKNSYLTQPKFEVFLPKIWQERSNLGQYIFLHSQEHIKHYIEHLLYTCHWLVGEIIQPNNPSEALKKDQLKHISTSIQEWQNLSEYGLPLTSSELHDSTELYFLHVAELMETRSSAYLNPENAQTVSKWLKILGQIIPSFQKKYRQVIDIHDSGIVKNTIRRMGSQEKKFEGHPDDLLSPDFRAKHSFNRHDTQIIKMLYNFIEKLKTGPSAVTLSIPRELILQSIATKKALQRECYMHRNESKYYSPMLNTSCIAFSNREEPKRESQTYCEKVEGAEIYGYDFFATSQHLVLRINIQDVRATDCSFRRSPRYGNLIFPEIAPRDYQDLDRVRDINPNSTTRGIYLLKLLFNEYGWWLDI